MSLRLNEIICGDCLEVMKSFPDNSIHCCVTSPPYWGLRDYGLEPSVWGGDPDCKHEWGDLFEMHDVREGTTQGKTRTTDRCYGEESRRFNGNHEKHTSGQFCIHCDAWLGCFGLEPTPELYVEHCVAIFREVKRVLRDDGTLWLNLGDTYTGTHTTYDGKQNKWQHGEYPGRREVNRQLIGKGLKPKDLVGIPWRVAFALQADGWYLRSDIIWHKPNPMPESVRDRPTKAHEYIFLMSKSRKYYYDADSIKEPMNATSIARYNYAFGGAKNEYLKLTDKPTAVVGNRTATDGRNKRTVWTVATQPFPEAHFATFPSKLIEPCILAGCPEGGIVLDVFGGAATTAVASCKLNRKYVLIELNPAYVEIGNSRILKECGQVRIF